MKSLPTISAALCVRRLAAIALATAAVLPGLRSLGEEGSDSKQITAKDPAPNHREPGTENRESSHYTQREPTRDGIGKVYMGREIAKVVGHGAIRWLERPEREREELPGKVVENMELKPGHTVADIGAGSGYFTFRVAKKVPEGKAIAVDINEKMLAFIEEREKELGMKNIETHHGTIEDTKLPEDTVDLAFMVDAYHEFSHPREMMESIVEAIKPGGRVIWIEYRKEDPTVAIKPLHKMTQAQVKKEAAAVGLTHLETRDFLPSQHFMIFQKPK